MATCLDRLYIVLPTALLVTLGALLGCEGHGKYTTAFLDEANADMARLRSATQYDLAMQQFHSGDLERALETIDDAIALRSDVGSAYVLRGRILLEMGQTDAAIAAFESGMALGTAEPELYYLRAIALERVDRLDEALADYRAAAEIDPSAPQYTLAAAEILMELGRLADARALLSDQSGDLGSNAGFRQALGHIAMLEGNPDEAIRSFKEATVLSPGDPVLLEDLCGAQITARRFAEAEAILRTLGADGRTEDRRDLSHLRASCLIALDRPVEARTILYRLVRSEDGADDVDAWLKLVDVALMLHDDGLLHSVANRLVAIAPGRHEGYLALAMWQRRTGDLDGALRSLDVAIDHAGENTAPRRLQAVIERERSAG